MTGKKHSESSKLKISKANKGRDFTKEHRQKLSEANKGKKISQETRAKMSKNNAKTVCEKFGYDLGDLI